MIHFDEHIFQMGGSSQLVSLFRVKIFTPHGCLQPSKLFARRMCEGLVPKSSSDGRSVSECKRFMDMSPNCMVFVKIFEKIRAGENLG